MSEWWQEFFDEDYLKVYRKRDAKMTDTDVAFARKVLKLRKGQRILDICSGYGRHSIRFALAGLTVTGFDQSRLFLDRARRAAGRQKVTVEWVQGDVRTMAFPPIFDAAVNMFTSIGYFVSDEENYQIIARGTQALRPGGRLLVDTINRDRIMSNPQRQRWAPVGRGVELERTSYDWERGRLNSRRVLMMPDGRKRETMISLRLYTVSEMRAMYERAGLEIVGLYGSTAGIPFTQDAPRIALVGRKPGGHSARRRR